MKKFNCAFKLFICLVIVCSTSLVYASPVKAENLLGDANNDGAIDAKDVLCFREKLAEFNVSFSDTNADVNCDGESNIDDMLNIRKYLANFITNFSSVFKGRSLEEMENYSAQPINLGTPGKDIYYNANLKYIYARNIWDMQEYNGEICFGCGNYEDNTGSSPIFWTSKDSSSWSYDTSVSTEQISRIFDINNNLMILATDPTYWLKGSYYSFNTRSWTEYQILTNNIHCYDVVNYDGKYFFGGPNYNGSRYLSDISYIDQDQINTSTNSTLVPMYVRDMELSDGTKMDIELNNYTMYRVYDFIECNDNLYAVEYRGSATATKYYIIDQATKDKIGYDYTYVPEYLLKYTYKDVDYSSFPYFTMDSTGVYKYNKDQMSFNKVENSESINAVINNRNLVKGYEYVQSEPCCTIKEQLSDGTMVLACNDIFTTKDFVNYSKVSLGEGYENYVVRDCKKNNGKYYIIASCKTAEEKYENVLFSTTDFNSFKNVLHFESDAFVRCFEYSKGSLFFGCGAYELEKGTDGKYLTDTNYSDRYSRQYYTIPDTTVSGYFVINKACGTLFRLDLFEE